ncbi:hypothetical protein ACNKHV_06490 [Shigella flexneri]
MRIKNYLLFTSAAISPVFSHKFWLRAKKCDNTYNCPNRLKNRIDMTNLPKFSTALLHPRYWLTQVGHRRTLVSRAIALPGYLPPRLWIRKTGVTFYETTRKNCASQPGTVLPEMSEQERRKMVVKNFESVGMGLMETGMAWFWPDRRIARWTEVIGIEHIRDVQAQKRGILLVGIHFLTLELGARQFGMQEPGSHLPPER